ncbi:uncharacterized protein LOC115810466 [Chanos chanos]|uniref:Uncharacterized protein LOC115810466 n=1 Tax=Chanos chanos TaxID=29144 RepID=A0A6J2V8T1_CHACN|nr:uncharacterized protein LOC115810466 [Chanos chanos]
MAESANLASELFPPEGAIPTDSALAADNVLSLSKSSSDVVKDRFQSEELRKSASEAACLQKDLKNGDQVQEPEKTGPHPTECAVEHATARNAAHAAEVLISARGETQPKEDHINHEKSLPCGGMLQASKESAPSSQRDLSRQTLTPARLPVQRSHSDSIPMFKEDNIPPHCETSRSCHCRKDQEVPTQPLPALVCKQAMPLQQSNTVMTFCRGGSSSSGNPTQQTQQGCIQICPSGSSNAQAEVGGEKRHQKFEEAACCGSFVHQGMLKDTFAAYCHPQPIPAPAQLLPRLEGTEGDCRSQMTSPGMLALPRLVSSVSETGLDAKKLLSCCSLDCNWPALLRPSGSQTHLAEERRSTREAGTMTSHRELRDVGVQAGKDLEEPPPHVFPEVCLVEDRVNGNDKGTAGSRKSPVREVKWDSEGMTWEVYGASVDPQELGLAIQRHLEIQIKETASRAAKLSRENTTTSRNSGGAGRRRGKKGGLMASLRNPGCCVRSSTAVD